MVYPHLDTAVPFAAGPGVPSFDDDAWDNLLNYIEERRVIPIVGPEPLRVETAAGPCLLNDWLADWLAEKLTTRLGVDVRTLPQPCLLNDVVCWSLAARGHGHHGGDGLLAEPGRRSHGRTRRQPRQLQSVCERHADPARERARVTG